MKLLNSRMALVWAACLGLTACDAPTLVSLQPIGAPLPTNAQQTFVDADGCSWWIIGNSDDLRWAPMTNSDGEHVCDGGPTQDVLENEPADAAGVFDQDTSFIDDTRAAIDGADVAGPAAGIPAVAAPQPTADGRLSYVQVATFAKESNVIASERLFRSLGYGIETGSEARDSDRLYRLILGPFQTRDEAQKAVERAFAEGFEDAFPFRK